MEQCATKLDFVSSFLTDYSSLRSLLVGVPVTGVASAAAAAVPSRSAAAALGAAPSAAAAAAAADNFRPEGAVVAGGLPGRGRQLLLERQRRGERRGRRLVEVAPRAVRDLILE